ncbi:hypothetical protein NE237_031623 [Protea cynaroides]|uniref:Reverse transcriptase zinc-binding domain-containing protein n=1 Tax=Protea cynaroides TaxID=273540 RepID=A0A9Q0L1W5_9MAGN|nr:hypothetical protein NE237_031623 [Protea cynaroides]
MVCFQLTQHGTVFALDTRNTHGTLQYGASSLSPRDSLIGWRWFNHKIPCDEAIWKRLVPITSRCHLCFKNEETFDHLFLASDFTQKIWKMILEIFNHRWEGFSSADLLFSWWQRKKCVTPLPKLWQLVLVITISAIWKSRNKSCFDGIKLTC